MIAVTNTHVRTFRADIAAVSRQLETLAGPHDNVWRTDLVPPMVLDDGLNPGSTGGHGPIRYSVVTHEPGAKILFTLDPASIGMGGWHGFELAPAGDGLVRISHTLAATLTGRARLLWRPIILPLHNGVVEDVFDHLERSATGTAHRQQRTSGLLRWWARRKFR